MIEVDDAVGQRLDDEPIIWLATTRPDGRPHLVPVWFWRSDDTVLIFSKNDQKIRNIQRQPRVMVALNAADDGEDIALFEGQAELSPESSSAVMPAEYAAKYAALLHRLGLTADEMAAAYLQPIIIRLVRQISI